MPTYDGNGNLTKDEVGNTYDTENQLTQANATSLGNIVTFAYDPIGRRATKTSTGTIAGTTNYLSDGSQEIAEYSSGTLLRRWVYGPGIDEPIVRIEISGSTSTYYYNHQDGLGSVVATTTSTGAVSTKYTYGPFGETNALTGNGARFTGRRLDPETGLYYYRARYYSTTLGRFLQTDPIGTKGGINLYAYVRNDPGNRVDPMGTTSQLAPSGGSSQALAPPSGSYLAPSAVGTVASAPFVAAFGAMAVMSVTLTGDSCNICNDLLVTNTTVQFETTQYALPASMQNLTGLTAGYWGDDNSMQMYHYSYAAYATGFANGLNAGAFATPLGDLTGTEAQQGLALQNPVPPDSVYTVTPAPGTPYVFNPSAAPMFGQPGGLPEYWFPTGTGPGTVTGPTPVKPSPGPS